MKPPEFESHGKTIDVKFELFIQQSLEIAPAPDDAESTDPRSDSYSEALFLRAFTCYESSIERLFLHYVTGGLTLSGKACNSYLSIEDETLARRLTKGSYKFLSWAKPQEIRILAENYIENGWPISAMMNSKSQILSDCERIRNRIAHSSVEAINNFNVVQRNFLTTERLFEITPGQFLRIRNKKRLKTHLTFFLQEMLATLQAIIDPPD